MAQGDYTARGIILHSVKYGDNGLIVYMYTDVNARQSYFVNRARNGKISIGKNKTVIQPLSVVEMVAYPPLKGELHKIKEMSNSFSQANIMFDIRKSTMALFMAEVIYRVVREVEPNPMFFDFLVESVRNLDAIEEGISNYHLYFMVQLSRYLGFFPANNHQEHAFFDIKRGEFVMIKPQHPLFMEPTQAYILGALMNTTADRLGELHIRRNDRINFLTSLMDFFAHHHDTIYTVQSFRILGEIF